jgi:hypothetical protein
MVTSSVGEERVDRASEASHAASQQDGSRSGRGVGFVVLMGTAGDHHEDRAPNDGRYMDLWASPACACSIAWMTPDLSSN